MPKSAKTKKVERANRYLTREIVEWSFAYEPHVFAALDVVSKRSAFGRGAGPYSASCGAAHTGQRRRAIGKAERA